MRPVSPTRTLQGGPKGGGLKGASDQREAAARVVSTLPPWLRAVHARLVPVVRAFCDASRSVNRPRRGAAPSGTEIVVRIGVPRDAPVDFEGTRDRACMLPRLGVSGAFAQWTEARMQATVGAWDPRTMWELVTDTEVEWRGDLPAAIGMVHPRPVIGPGSRIRARQIYVRSNKGIRINLSTSRTIAEVEAPIEPRDVCNEDAVRTCAARGGLRMYAAAVATDFVAPQALGISGDVAEPGAESRAAHKARDRGSMDQGRDAERIVTGGRKVTPIGRILPRRSPRTGCGESLHVPVRDASMVAGDDPVVTLLSKRFIRLMRWGPWTFAVTASWYDQDMPGLAAASTTSEPTFDVTISLAGPQTHVYARSREPEWIAASLALKVASILGSRIVPDDVVPQTRLD